MRASGQTTANFFAENFSFLEELFKYSKPDNFFIDNEVLINRCLIEREKNGRSVDVQKLEDYKIVKLLQNGDYELNKKFTDFISFLSSDFRLDLPSSIEKYRFPIEKNFLLITHDNYTLNSQKSTNQIISLVNEIMNDVQEFELQIDENTFQLFTESTELSANKKDISYTHQIEKATELIESYIQPINDILNKEQSDSFIKKLISIADFAGIQKFENEDIGIRKQFERLYQSVRNAKESILKNSSIMAKDVSPLIDRLRTDSAILRGSEIVLMNAKRGTFDDVVTFYKVKGKKSRIKYAIDFQFSAESILANIRKQEDVNFSESEVSTEENPWVFSEQRYKQKLLNDLPINNFFYWCYKTIKEESIKIDSRTFYHLSSLLFLNDFDVFFQKDSRSQIILSDYKLDVPQVKLTRKDGNFSSSKIS